MFVALAFALSVVSSEPAVVPCAATPPPGMSCIPGGPFLRGATDAQGTAKDGNARPQSSVWLQTFYMDQYEVTFAEYGECIAAKKCKKAGPSYPDFDAPKQPIAGISWFDARDFCAWRGKRLPTEAQWEKAARGTDGRIYPWGDEPATCERAIYKDARGRSCGVPQNSKNHKHVGRPEPVGSRPATQYGLFDMAGNGWEWTADWSSPSWKACGAACAGVDPQGPCAGKPTCATSKRKIVRGGSWYWPAERMTTFHRRPHEPANAPIFHHFGFRCAATLDDPAAAEPQK
jgi:sulfatase modifying factor 1